jgi:hypothetical protein
MVRRLDLRSAEITVSNTRPFMQTFTRSRGLLRQHFPTPVTISAGTHTITIGNQNGPGPSIDKIVISQP